MHAYRRLLRTLLILIARACLRMIPLVPLVTQQGLFRLVPLLFPIGVLLHFFAHMITETDHKVVAALRFGHVLAVHIQDGKGVDARLFIAYGKLAIRVGSPNPS